MFVKNGIRGITMDGIASEMSISKRTIYENFRDKNALLSSCLDYMQEQQKNNRMKIMKNSANAIEVILNFLTKGIQNLSYIDLSFLSDLKKYHHQVWTEHYQKFSDKNLKETHDLLSRGIREGVIRKEINVEIVSRIIHEQLNIMTDEDIFPPSLYSKKEIFENIVINFAGGISTNIGLEVIENYDKNKIIPYLDTYFLDKENHSIKG